MGLVCRCLADIDNLLGRSRLFATEYSGRTWIRCSRPRCVRILVAMVSGIQQLSARPDRSQYFPGTGNLLGRKL